MFKSTAANLPSAFYGFTTTHVSTPTNVLTNCPFSPLTHSLWWFRASCPFSTTATWIQAARVLPRDAPSLSLPDCWWGEVSKQKDDWLNCTQYIHKTTLPNDFRCCCNYNMTGSVTISKLHFSMSSLTFRNIPTSFTTLITENVVKLLK